MPTAPKPIKTKDVGGRPSNYHDRLIPHVRKLAKIAATEAEIAELLGINITTFIDWKARYPRFNHALELGRAQANKRVQRALFHRAVGYQYPATKVFNDKGNIIKTEITEHIPPDTNAAVFWLKNRDPENWQDRTGLDVTGNLSVIASTVSAARTRLLTAKANAPTIEAQLDSDSVEVVESE